MSDSQLSAGATDPNWKPESGHVGNLSTVQQAALDKFKEDIKAEGAFVDERMDDPMLLRCVSFILFIAATLSAFLLELACARHVSLPTSSSML
jgi:hypothetical protein